MLHIFLKKIIFVIIIICINLLFSACYNPLIRLQSIGLEQDYTIQTQNKQIKKHIQTNNTNKNKALVFYKECSRNGSAWLFECQSIGLESIQQAIILYYPNTFLNNIYIYFYPKKAYIRFEIYDSTLFQNL